MGLCQSRKSHSLGIEDDSTAGSPGTSFIYGVSHDLPSSQDSSAMYERWATEHGVAYMIPSDLGQTIVVLFDPKAIAHFYTRGTWTFAQTPLSLAILVTSRDIMGSGYYLQRKALAPVFSNAAVRKLTSVFYGSAYKAKGVWDTAIGLSEDLNTIIEVQNRLNMIGMIDFSHDFGSLDGKRPGVVEAFDTFEANLTHTLRQSPLGVPNMFKKLGITMGKISNDLLTRSRQEKDANTSEKGEVKSIIGLLRQDTGLHMSEEVVAQMRGLLFAGYETTSITLTWALIELSRHPDVQTSLREELLVNDPQYMSSDFGERECHQQ
ncbi:cytochrome P450 [Suillus decipiens]|nr:cytochrome P450 [Suillus decipiens]